MTGPHTWDRYVETQPCPNGCGVRVAWFSAPQVANLAVGRWFEFGRWSPQHGNIWDEHRCREAS